MDSLTLFRHLFKTPCEAICIFLDFFTEKRGSHRKIYDFFRKSHEMHCICKRFSIYCNKNCSGNMQILCPFAETTYAPSGDENARNLYKFGQTVETTYAPSGDENTVRTVAGGKTDLKQLTPRQGTKTKGFRLLQLTKVRNNLRPVRGRKQSTAAGIACRRNETTYAPSGDENSPFCYRRRRICEWKQLTPRQGTKTILSSGVCVCACWKQLTPRQGTKTLNFQRL